MSYWPQPTKATLCVSVTVSKKILLYLKGYRWCRKVQWDKILGVHDTTSFLFMLFSNIIINPALAHLLQIKAGQLVYRSTSISYTRPHLILLPAFGKPQHDLFYHTRVWWGQTKICTNKGRCHYWISQQARWSMHSGTEIRHTDRHHIISFQCRMGRMFPVSNSLLINSKSSLFAKRACKSRDDRSFDNLVD